ncbi:putative nuclease HARBI1 [Prorops nasuta]|uniref:putative nuclease HARBI1 n=1 Tax=Prorops nasuta TaxID=863751 RepID=UPI0034CE1A72
MDAALLIALDSELDLNLIKILIDDLQEPLRFEGKNREAVQKNENYVEKIIPLYSNNLFKDHFRISRPSFEKLINYIGNNMENPNYLMELPKKVMFTVWMLAKPESFLSVGDRFGIAKSSVHSIFKEITQILTNLLPENIKWPFSAEYHKIAHTFKIRSFGSPGIIGAIDGCHIPCKQPVNNAIDYYNRKGFHSILLQGVCDDKGRFIDVFIGLPGRIHDARVFRNSQLYIDLLNNENPLLPTQYHLIGDTAYPLLETLLTPFKDNGYLTDSQIIYNRKLSSVRSIIERVFGLLKCKFRRLKYLDISDFQLGNNIIASCCVLHNFIINENEIDSREIIVQEIENENMEDEFDYVQQEETTMLKFEKL